MLRAPFERCVNMVPLQVFDFSPVVAIFDVFDPISQLQGGWFLAGYTFLAGNFLRG
jgi:hypothetical protein